MNDQNKIIVTRIYNIISHSANLRSEENKSKKDE